MPALGPASLRSRKTLQTVTFPHPLKGVVSYLLKGTLEHVFPLSLLHCCKSSNHIDLPIPPPKLVDLWRIEGEGLDLLFHQTISPLSEGNIFDLDLGVALCFSFVLPPKSLHSISCFGWISERRTSPLSVFLPLHRLHRFEFSPVIRGS